jgi:hypothetical protein
MKKRWILLAVAGIVAITTLLLVVKPKGKSKQAPGKDYSSYISAYTSRTISSRSNIQVVFAAEFAGKVIPGENADKRLLRFSPSVGGKLVWMNSRTLEFYPEEPLPQGKEFTVTVALARLVKSLPKGFEQFEFTFRTPEQSLEVELAGLEFYQEAGKLDRRLGGTIRTADFADPEKMKGALTARQENQDLAITWESASDGLSHRFWIEGVKQGDSPSRISIKVNGKTIGASYSETLEYEIPVKGEFRLLINRVIQSPEQYVEFRFSEPLDPVINLQGLINPGGNFEVRFSIEGNVVKCYPTKRQSGTYNFEIAEGIRSVAGQKLAEAVIVPVQFEVLKPQVRMVGQGVILPASGNILLPFQAVSLRAVDVKIMRIFENNIGQFLQVNNLEGSRELRRVGRMLLKKTILLNTGGELDYGNWNTFHLDLSNLITPEPGAIYQVTLSMRKQYSAYGCEGQTNNEPIEIREERYDASDDAHQAYYYDYYEDEEYYYDDDYNWRERDNPCDNSYYRNRSESRNILASNLGMIAKRGEDGRMIVIVTDLLTARPLSGVRVDILNYQQQPITNAVTGSDGIAWVELKGPEKPFLAIASHGKQRGYLKLDEGSSLSLSSFDISGKAVERGIKGFLYGERGVWRPGDSLYITLIVEDREKSLPENHPVTFELADPRGQVVHRAISSTGVDGMYAFPVPTAKDAPTGMYMARAKVGGVTFSLPVRVETIMPNRLKINLDFGVKELKANRDISGTLNAKWLHGAPARMLKAKVDATLSQSSTSFANYKGYTFDDPARSFSAEEHTLFQGTLNEGGSATFAPRINVESAAPGVLRANFVVRVFEEGGAFSIDRFTMPYYPYQKYVGVKLPDAGTRGNMLVTDTVHKVKIVTVNADGKPVPCSNLKVEVYKMDWRWWWDNQYENMADYISNSYNRIVQRGIVSTNANGEGTFDLRVNHPDWGRFLVKVSDPEGGHATGVVAYMDWPGWVKRDRSAMPEGATMLVFASDKTSYQVGETATLSIPSSEGSKILISIENGVKVLRTDWVDAQKGETRFAFKITDAMTPNVYVHTALIQPHGQTHNDLPLRMYGIIPILVENPRTHLHPVIETPQEFEPEKKATIRISEKEGNPMTVTLAVVDEGLLDLTRFKTPDPWNSFYAREALGVKTWDLFDLVMGAWAGRMQRILSIGGDQEALSQGDKTADRFKPVVKVLGPFRVGRGEKKKVSFTMPNYVGSVRVMVIAAREGAYGNAEQAVPVRKPLMVLSTLPRVLGPEEEVVLPVTVFAMDKRIREVRVKIAPNDLLMPQESTEQTISFADVGDKVVKFKLKVASKLGIGRIKVTASSGSNSATHETELDIRNPNPPMTLVQDIMLNAKQTWTPTYKAFGMAGTNRATLEISSLPPIDLGRRLAYLVGYPHGCLEQTTSGAFPQLFISKLGDFDDKTRAAAEQNVRAGLDKIRAFRTMAGGLSLWPGNQQPDEWASTYAGHFMLEAEALGYSLPIGVMEGWKKYQKQMALSWSPSCQQGYYNADLMQAYRLYTLALAKSPEMGAMNRLREYPKLSVPARYRLAAAYALAGNNEAARNLIQGVGTEVAKYRELGYTYGSDIRDKAMIAEALTLMKDPEGAMLILRDLSAQMSREGWMSTQEIAFSLLAYSKFASATKSSEGIEVAVVIDGKDSRKIKTDLTLAQYPFEPVQRGEGNIKVDNKGNGSVYARLVTQGIPVAGNETPQSENITMSSSYFLMNGNSINPEKLEQGTDFYVEVRVYNPGSRGNLEQMALSMVIPSGWEIRNTRMEEASAVASSAFTYQDIRDDRVYTYFDLPKGQTKTFKVAFNAAYIGKFYLPAFVCEAMYDNSMYSRNSGKWVDVIAPGE